MIKKAELREGREWHTYMCTIYPTFEQEKKFRKILWLMKESYNLIVDHYNKLGHVDIFWSYNEAFKKLAKPRLKKVFETTPYRTLVALRFKDVAKAVMDFVNSCRGLRNGMRMQFPKHCHYTNSFIYGVASIRKNCKRRHFIIEKQKVKKDPKEVWLAHKHKRPKVKEKEQLVDTYWLSKDIGYLRIDTQEQFIDGIVHYCHIILTPTGEWKMAVLVDRKIRNKCYNGKIVGIDWNATQERYIVDSDGHIISCPCYLAMYLEVLAELLKKLVRISEKGKKYTKHYWHIRWKIRYIYKKIRNLTKDYNNKLVKYYADHYEYIVFEDINLVQMAHEKHHGKALSLQSFGDFRNHLLRRATCGLKINPKETSQNCHHCGFVNKAVKQGVEEWTCPSCGMHHQRDLNAAINIRQKGATKINKIKEKMQKLNNELTLKKKSVS